MKLPIWFFMPEWARAKYREHLQSEADGEYEQLKKNAEHSVQRTVCHEGHNEFCDCADCLFDLGSAVNRRR